MFEALANPTSPSYQSVKLPAALVSAAKESAQTFRRSTSGQIEYWAALGRKLEKNGLTISQAGEALQRGSGLGGMGVPAGATLSPLGAEWPVTAAPPCWGASAVA